MTTALLKFIDKYIYWLVWVSVHLLVFELALGKENSLDSSLFVFLIIERITACIFIFEYFARWYEDYENPDGTLDIGHHYYPFSYLGIVDLLSWLPFVIGFFVPAQYLGLIRALRIIRALKLFRYSKSLQLVALAIYSRRQQFYSVFTILYIVGLFCICSLYVVESKHNEDFANIFNVLWFYLVSMTTVGYGDMSPVTPLGKFLCSVFVFFPAIGMAGSLFGILGDAWGEITELSQKSDPVQEFINKHGK